MDEIINFKYPEHITQDEKDLHRIARYKYLTLGLELQSYENAMTTKISSDGVNFVPMPLPPLHL